MLHPHRNASRAQRRLGPLARVAMLCAAWLPAIVGCQPAGESSATSGEVASPTGEEEETPLTPDDVPLPVDYADAVRRLCEYRDAVRQAIASGHLHDAHRPLDETTIALERLPAIAKTSGVPRRDWETIVVAGDDLAEALAAVHEAIDAGQSPDYEARAPAIDGALQRLQRIAKQAAIEPDSQGTRP